MQRFFKLTDDFFEEPQTEAKTSAPAAVSLYGEYYFKKALEVRNTVGHSFSAEELTFLHQAQELKNFHGAREIQFYLFTQSEIKPDKIIEHAENIANTFLTPGHLLAATSYIKLANLYEKNDPIMHESSYFNALRHLILAKELESISQAQIKHAYFNENVAMAFQKGYASLLNITFESFDKLIKQFTIITQLNETFVRSTEHQAKITAQAIKNALTQKQQVSISILSR